MRRLALLLLPFLASCGPSPTAGYFFAVEEIRQFACTCEQTIDGRDPCQLSIRERTRTCFEDWYDDASDLDREVFDCVDDVFTEYATCMDELDGCDQNGADVCLAILENETCPEVANGAGLAACGTVADALE